MKHEVKTRLLVHWHHRNRHFISLSSVPCPFQRNPLRIAVRSDSVAGTSRVYSASLIQTVPTFGCDPLLFLTSLNQRFDFGPPSSFPRLQLLVLHPLPYH